MLRESSHLSVIQVTEASDDLLLVQLIRFELHASNRLHDAVIVEALLPRKLRLLRRAVLEAVQVAFLPTNRGHALWKSSPSRFEMSPTLMSKVT